jgi:hypothetical protein
MRVRYGQVLDGERIRPKMKGWKQACCDCGLVHRFEFFIVPNQFKRLVVEFTARRDARATAARRRRAAR